VIQGIAGGDLGAVPCRGQGSRGHDSRLLLRLTAAMSNASGQAPGFAGLPANRPNAISSTAPTVIAESATLNAGNDHACQ